MDTVEHIKALQQEIENLSNSIRTLSEKQNSQYTDLMLKLDELKVDKERLDLVLMDSAQEMENLFEKAKREVIHAGKASTSYLQRKLGIGYEKACMLMERLEEEFIVSESEGAKPRKVLVKNMTELNKGAFATEMKDPNTEDDLFEEAKKIAIEVGRVSTSYLQRKLGTGYARSARLMDMLEDAGVIEKGNGAKPRKVLVPAKS